MNEELLTVRQTDHLLTLAEEQLEEMRTAIRERLEKPTRAASQTPSPTASSFCAMTPSSRGKSAGTN